MKRLGVQSAIGGDDSGERVGSFFRKKGFTSTTIKKQFSTQPLNIASPFGIINIDAKRLSVGNGMLSILR